MRVFKIKLIKSLMYSREIWGFEMVGRLLEVIVWNIVIVSSIVME